MEVLRGKEQLFLTKNLLAVLFEKIKGLIEDFYCLWLHNSIQGCKYGWSFFRV